MDKTLNLQTIRHSTAHVLAGAVQKLYPDVKFGIGPAIENGFYYDFDFGDQKISEEDLPKIEAEMEKIIAENLPFIRKEISVGEAREVFADQPYKLELLEDKAQIGNRSLHPFTYKVGGFTDLCKGPHVKNTSEIKAFKLTRLAGAYWKGSEKNPMLTRIYGLAFETQKELDEYLKLQEEAKKHDHRKLSKELDFFSQNEMVGPGLILWHPKLSVVREEIELWWRKEHRKRGYQYVYTPHIGKEVLWQTSGHTDFYKDLMYPPLKDERDDVYYVKPMNCPFHVLIYKSRPRSYKELPLRWGELGTVYRYELEGVRHGILRPRGFTQDDAHIICTKEQIVPELEGVLDFALEMNTVFGFDNLHYELSLRDPETPEKYIGDTEGWEMAQKVLKDILDSRGVEYNAGIGEAKFYGPAIDLKVEDAVGRLWQGTTIQFDFNLPEKFEMTYVGEDGKDHTPYMIHRTLLGSMERFVGCLIEHYAGAFPVWLAPVQVVVIPISERHNEYARSVVEKLRTTNYELRTNLDDRDETMQAKIRDAQLQKVPYMLIVGDKEEKAGTVSERGRSGKDYGQVEIDEFITNIKKEIEEKTIN